MNKVYLEYINFNPKLHKEFPIIRQCKVYKKGDIINVYIDVNKDVESITDDFGFDASGKFYYIEYGQWHNSQTGKYIPIDEFYDLNEFDYEYYEYVSFVVKFYSNIDYKTCFHEKTGSKLTVSYIPYRMIDFTERTADMIFKM